MLFRLRKRRDGGRRPCPLLPEGWRFSAIAVSQLCWLTGIDSSACDTVIFAVGMKPDMEFTKELGLELGPRGWINVNGDQQSSREGIFAAGDISAVPASIARAIGDGRRAAFAAHGYLTGEKARVFIFNDENILEARDEMAGLSDPYIVPFNEIYGASQYKRVEPHLEEANACAKSFTELNRGLDEETAVAEAARCMHCGHCKSCGTYVDDCPGYVLEMVTVAGAERPEVMYGYECWHCANCRTSCPTGAIGFRFPLRMQVWGTLKNIYGEWGDSVEIYLLSRGGSR